MDAIRVAVNTPLRALSLVELDEAIRRALNLRRLGIESAELSRLVVVAEAVKPRRQAPQLLRRRVVAVGE